VAINKHPSEVFYHPKGLPQVALEQISYQQQAVVSRNQIQAGDI